MKYRVEVDQTLTMVVEVDAESVEDAQRIAEEIVEETGHENAVTITANFADAGEAWEVPA